MAFVSPAAGVLRAMSSSRGAAGQTAIVHATDLSKAIGREIRAGSSMYSCLCS
jgi:hypothetical protein